MKKVLLSTAIGAFLLFAAGPSFALEVNDNTLANSGITATENNTDVDVDAKLEFTDIDVNKTYTKDSHDVKVIDSHDTFTKTETEIDTEIDTEIYTQQNQVAATQLLGAAVSGNFVTLAANGGQVQQSGSGVEAELHTGNASSSMSGDGLSTAQAMTGIHNAGVNAVGLTVQMNNSGL